MRRPTLQAALVPEASQPLTPGLSNYLSGLAELSDVIFSTDHPLISFLPAGPMPPAASALIDTERGRTLLRQLTDIADVTVVDTPPLSVGADASLLAASASETIAVVDLQRSSKKAIRSAFGQLRLVGAELVGVILNRVRETGGESGYYYAEDPRVQRRRRLFGRARSGRGQLEDTGPTPQTGEPFLGHEQPDHTTANGAGGVEPGPVGDRQRTGAPDDDRRS